MVSRRYFIELCFFLNQSVDLTNTENSNIAFRGDQIESELTTNLQFFEDLLLKLPHENFKKN